MIKTAIDSKDEILCFFDFEIPQCKSPRVLSALFHDHRKNLSQVQLESILVERLIEHDQKHSENPQLTTRHSA